MATEIAKLFATVGANTSDFDRKMDQVSGKARETGKAMGSGLGEGAKASSAAMSALVSVGIPLTIGGLVALGRQAASTMTELAQLGAQTEMVSSGFTRLAGSRATDMLSDLRAASQGTIDDLNLMLSANRAMMLGVASTSEDLMKLMEVAMTRGQAMGLTTQQAFDNIVTGIGRASPLILDNLGIVINADETYAEYARSIGVASDALTEHQKTQALASRVMAEATGEMKTLGESAAPATLSTAITNLRTEIGLSLTSWRELMLEIAAGAEEATNKLRQARVGKETQLEFGKTVWELDLPYEQLVGASARMNELRAAYENGSLAADAYNRKMAELKSSYLSGAIGVIEYRDEVAKLDESYQSGELGMTLYQQRADTMMQTLIQLAAAHSQVGIAAEIAERQLANFSSAELALMSTRPGWELGTDVQYGTGKRSVITQEQADKNRRKYLASIGVVIPGVGASGGTAGGGAIGSGYSAAQAATEQAQAEFKSLVQGLLQPTQVTAQDIMATQAGMYGTAAYPEKWDEAVRQFRMAEKGHTPWDIYQYEQEFYGGQRLGEVNWEGLLAAGQQQQQYKAGQQLLLQTAMGKFAEAGIGMQKEEVAQLLGVPQDYQEVGADRSADLLAGMQSANVGGQLSESVTQQMRAKRESWIEAGRDVAGLFIQGFQEGSQPELVQSLVDAILPDVLEVVRR